MIHLFFKKLGEPNFCGARMSIADERRSPDHERVPMTGSTPVLRISAYPRGCEVNLDSSDPEKPVVGLRYFLWHNDPPEGQGRKVVAQSSICPICMLLFTVMQANNTTSLNTARCILKREGKASR